MTVDLPLDRARKLYRFLYESSHEWDDVAAAIQTTIDDAGDGITLTVDAH